jgi:hypothetical protein
MFQRQICRSSNLEVPLTNKGYRKFRHPQIPIGKIYRVARSMLMTDFSDGSTWMTEFSVTNTGGVCVMFGFLNKKGVLHIHDYFAQFSEAVIEHLYYLRVE